MVKGVPEWHVELSFKLIWNIKNNDLSSFSNGSLSNGSYFSKFILTVSPGWVVDNVPVSENWTAKKQRKLWRAVVFKKFQQ